MKNPKVRWGLAVLVAVVLIGAIVGIGQGGGGSSGDQASNGTATATSGTTTSGGSGDDAGTPEQRLAALGAVAETGRKAFSDNGCGGCHRLADADSTGSIGPDLDQAISAQDQARIREDIIDPNKQIADGFSSNVMPFGYADKMSPEELDALVEYLHAATHQG